MAQIRHLLFLAQLRSEASNFVIRYKNGTVRKSGRGLVFWFRPETASIAEVPMDDREMTLFVSGRSQDFQDIAVQGSLTWHVVEPEKLAQRVDFSISLANGQYRADPVEQIQSRIAGLVNQAALQYLGGRPVRVLLDEGPEPMRVAIGAALADEPVLGENGIAIAAIRLTTLSPSSELQRALQTPTFEALQQKADEATFERRALAVEKERAISENELANKIELAKREKQLIAEEAANARDRAESEAAAKQIAAEAEAVRIRSVEQARAEAELAHVGVYRDMPPAMVMGLAARELAGKLTKIEHVNITPDLFAAVSEAMKSAPPPPSPPARAPKG